MAGRCVCGQKHVYDLVDDAVEAWRVHLVARHWREMGSPVLEAPLSAQRAGIQAGVAVHMLQQVAAHSDDPDHRGWAVGCLASLPVAMRRDEAGDPAG
jgi:hypothetical protein